MLLKKIIRYLYSCLNPSKKEQNFKIRESALLKNVFNGSFSKNALLSFITTPFENKNKDFAHTNKLEAYTIAEVLNELGYNVDVINYNEQEFIQISDYDLIIGFGQAIETILYSVTKINFKLILYRNGTETGFSDKLALNRIYKLYKEKSVLLLDSTRIYPLPWKAQHYFADKIIALGNKFVAKSYSANTIASVSSLNLFYFDVGTINLTKKDFTNAKYNFLWFGSLGAIHKGLDLLLEYFSAHKNLNLFICGLNQQELKFKQVYQKYFQLDNIKDLGFINLKSEQFLTLLYNCGAVINPTISEGGGGAVLNVTAAGGLIPIVTKNQGLDFNNNEILINDFTQKDVDKAINEYLSISEKSLYEKSKEILNFIRNKHTFKKYKLELRQIISDTINIK